MYLLEKYRKVVLEIRGLYLIKRKMNLQAKDIKTSGRPSQIGVGVCVWLHSKLSTKMHLPRIAPAHLCCCVTMNDPAAPLAKIYYYI